MKYYGGCDSGSTYTKCVILDETGKMVADVTLRSRINSVLSAQAALDEAVAQVPDLKSAKDLAYLVGTGYGRNKVPFADENISEISCHAMGVHVADPSVRSIIDIGGQDAKAIRLDNKGGIKQFFMNDKCAAGTGRFIEVMARVLETTLDEMATLDEQAEDTAPISSTCTVFAESEVISQLSKGTDRKSIARGVHMSVASRACGLAYRAGLEKDIVFTGGVAKNAGVVRAVSSVLKTDVIVAPNPQTTGALGAALFAYEAATKK